MIEGEPEAVNGYFVVDQDEQGRRSLADERRFFSLKLATKRVKFLRSTPNHFTELEVGWWTGDGWSDFHKVK